MEEYQKLGWSDFFDQQCTKAEVKQYEPTRLFSAQKDSLLLKAACGEFWVPFSGKMRAAGSFVVGDWFLFDIQKQKIIRRLERKSLFRRVTSAKHLYIQPIAANIDTLFIVTSCNLDFNLARLERYLALAEDGGAKAVIVLTKKDLCEDDSFYIQQLQTLGELDFVFINALEEENLVPLKKWLGLGQTVALMGSSGVGKSTIVNTLIGQEVQKTKAIREDDAKGRHTTTYRSIYQLETGGLLLDNPGIRDLHLLSSVNSLSHVFKEITAFAQDCQFKNCRHEATIGCAVQRALKEGQIPQRRFDSYQKLISETQRMNDKLDKRLKSEKHHHQYRKSNKVRYDDLK